MVSDETATAGDGADDVIEDFLERYSKEVDFYESAARAVARRLEEELQSEGVRCMVTSRAKSPAGLEAKVRQRNRTNPYAASADIYADIVDLAGVRVALYFPGERGQVGRIVERLFNLRAAPKTFPVGASRDGRRFSGYSATHYRVNLRAGGSSDRDARYSLAVVEIQIASVLMHAWSEVEHDLVYKPFQGELSEPEYLLLDQLNGLVIAGEIALEQLQRAGEVRVAEKGRPFGNHYELAAHLLSRASEDVTGPVNDEGLGRVDYLYELATRSRKNTPEMLAPYLESLHDDLERRPLAEQIIDAMLLDEPELYELYEKVRMSSRPGSSQPMPRSDPSLHEAMGEFMANWVRLEGALRAMGAPVHDSRGRPVPLGRVFRNLDLLKPSEAREIDLLRRLRNDLVHGVEVPSALMIRRAAARIAIILGELEGRSKTPNPSESSA